MKRIKQASGACWGPFWLILLLCRMVLNLRIARRLRVTSPGTMTIRRQPLGTRGLFEKL